MMPASPSHSSKRGMLFAFARPALVPHERAQLAGTLFRSGPYEVRLATRKKDIRKAQRLRFKVFYEEGGAIADRTASLIRRDVCPFDAVCDHLIVVDHDARNRFGRRKAKVVGVYRLLRDDVAAKHGGFYSAGEFDIAPLIARNPGKRFLELGRSCVAATHRNRHMLDLLWRGLALYIGHHRIDVLIGCASFPGVDPVDHAAALRFLTIARGADDEWRIAARPDKVASFDAAQAPTIDARAAIASLPPLIKGYLRCGAIFGEGVVVDRQFGTTDVFAIMPVARIAPRYLAHFVRDEASIAA